MTISTTLFTVLSSAAAVAALVGSRIYPVLLDQGAGVLPSSLPAITYQRISEIREGSFGGPNALPGTLIQVDSWASSFLGAEAVAEAVRKAIDGYQGTPAGGNQVQASILENQVDHYEAEVKIYRRQQDYRLWWVEV